MKVDIIFSDGTKQINFTPENEDEKQALKLITPSDDIQLAVQSGQFGEDYFKPFSIKIDKCKGGYLRAFSSSDSIMLVLTPKPKTEERVASAEQIAIEFTEEKLSTVNSLLSDDYKTGFKEGIQKYIENFSISYNGS